MSTGTARAVVQVVRVLQFDARSGRAVPPQVDKPVVLRDAGQRLGIQPTDIVIIGSGYCGTNTLGKRGTVGAGGAKVPVCHGVLTFVRNLLSDLCNFLEQK